MSQTLQPIRYTEGRLFLLNQIVLPTEFVYEEIKTCEEAFEAIRDMKVRGAPALAIAAVLSVAVEASHALSRGEQKSKQEIVNWVSQKVNYLITARPTAVNLKYSCELLLRKVEKKASRDDVSAEGLYNAIIEEAVRQYHKDIEDNLSMGRHGCNYVIANVHRKDQSASPKLRVLTHCNAGALATVAHGTALGVIRQLSAAGLCEEAFCTETRPWNQGARLTSFELVHDGIPTTLVVDSAVSFLLSKNKVDFIVTGADRVCANGDTANKIGTYQLAITAKQHGIPFFIAAPLTTLDASLSCGSEITIEERGADEVTNVCIPPAVFADFLRRNAPGVPAPTGVTKLRIVDERVRVWNPAFDVTPAALITAIFTDAGVITKEADGTFDIPNFLKVHRADD